MPQAARRRHFSRLFTQPEYRTGAAFKRVQAEAKVKRLVGEPLNEIDRAVLDPPIWSLAPRRCVGAWRRVGCTERTFQVSMRVNA